MKCYVGDRSATTSVCQWGLTCNSNRTATAFMNCNGRTGSAYRWESFRSNLEMPMVVLRQDLVDKPPLCSFSERKEKEGQLLIFTTLSFPFPYHTTPIVREILVDLDKLNNDTGFPGRLIIAPIFHTYAWKGQDVSPHPLHPRLRWKIVVKTRYLEIEPPFSI